MTIYERLKLKDISGRRAIVIASLVVFLLAGMAGCGRDEDKVARIIDGDTVVMGDGRKVRYIGIDTPERGDPYYKEATAANSRLVKSKKVSLEYDKEERDRYGRTLAFLFLPDGVAHHRKKRKMTCCKYLRANEMGQRETSP